MILAELKAAGMTSIGKTSYYHLYRVGLAKFLESFTPQLILDTREVVMVDSNSTQNTVAKILEHSHSPRGIAERLAQQHQPSYLKDFVYGAIDGAVTTFAVVSGVAGAGLSSSIVLILGIANLVGDGFSMAAGNFMGTRAEQEQLAKLRLMEQQHIETVPEGEREEIRQIFQSKGFEGELLDQVVDVITADKKQWVDTMLQEEHGMSLTPISALKAATTTFIAFLMIGTIPLLPFLGTLVSVDLTSQPYAVSTLLTGVAFFLVGAAKSRFVDHHWFYSGMETLFVGGLAAGLAYVCGGLLSGFA